MTPYSSSLRSLFLLFLCATALIACQRKAIHKKHPEMVGNWRHIEYPSKDIWYLEIGDKSWGTVTVYDSTGRDKNYNGENPRRWRVKEKNNRLYNGIISPLFTIDQYPVEVTTSPVIHHYDTIAVGRTYCIINGDYYRKAE